jgi:hypothetical protein
VHRKRSRHTNVDTLNRTLVDNVEVEEDIGTEILDYRAM